MHLMAGLLADQIQLPLERVSPQARPGRHEQLLNHRHALPSGRPDIRLVRAYGDFPPADQSLALTRDELLDHSLALGPLGGEGRQEHKSGRVLSRLRQRHPEGRLGHAQTETREAGP